MPSSDCAPLVYAWEAGLFARYGLDVELRRETRWSEIRDKVVSGDLDAAQAPASLPFVANLGLDSDPFACVSGLVLSLQGNGIAISRELWDEGVHSAESLRDQIYRDWRRRTYTFAVTSLFSPEHLILRQWLKAGGIIPESEIRLVVVPPDQLFPTIKLGYIDGFSAGEPWIGVSAEAGMAKCVSSGAVLAPRHPVKVLMVRQSFAAGRAEEHERLLAALIEACDFCNRPANRGVLSDMLAPPEYVNAPSQLIEAGLPGVLASSNPWDAQPVRPNVFAGDDNNEPSDEKAERIITGLYEALGGGVAKLSPQGRSPVLKNIFRADIFARAKALLDGERRRGETEWKSALTG